MPTSDNDFPFDEVVAASYVGKYILVGITYRDHTGAETRRQQLHGTIRSADRDGILISLAGAYAGETWNMPPLLSVISPAEPGDYHLKSTNETVSDPDLIATWTVTDPSPESGSSSP